MKSAFVLGVSKVKVRAYCIGSLLILNGCAPLRVDSSMIHGSVAAGFEEVEQAFRDNFAQRGELGAACAVYLDGKKIVDLWGGYRDASTKAPWNEDTMVLVFSATKGLSAIAMAVARSRGWLDYDERVATYWPEFAQAGKQDITVRQLLAHQAGLAVIDMRLNVKRLADLDFVAGAIAKQRPLWTPGMRHGYHGMSLGWYENELIRRVDPQHRSIGQFLREEIAQPLGAELYIGLPNSVPEERIARIKAFGLVSVLLQPRGFPRAMVLSLMWPWSMAFRSLSNPWLNSPATLDTPAYRAIEFPSANGIVTARSLAKAYGAFATGGEALGLTPAVMAELTAPPVAPSGGDRDLILRIDVSYSLGFSKPSRAIRFGTDERSFGAPGVGGSFGFADPTARIGYAYVLNKMGAYMYDDPREKAVRDALYRCLQRAGAVK